MFKKPKLSRAKSSTPRLWTQGSILNNLLLLSWPMIVMETTYMVSQIFDMIWVGRTGSAPLAALGIASMVSLFTMTVDFALVSGARAMIARLIGAGDNSGASKVAGQVYILAFFWGVLVTIGGLLLARPILNSLRVEPAVVEEGVRYLRIVFLGWLSLDFMVMGIYMMQSSGDTFNAMIIEVGARVLHLALCPLLVLGVGFFPQMGIAGAALSNVISQILGAIIGIWFLFGGHTRLKLHLQDIHFVPQTAWRVLKIGIPNFISMGQATFASFVLTWIIAPFGTLAIAAHSLVSNVQSFVMTPNTGLSNGVSVLVGQNLGVRKTDRAVKSTLIGVLLIAIFSLLCCLIILIWAEGIVRLFNTDPLLVGIGATFLRIATVCYFIMGLTSAFTSCLNGAGDTLSTMIINIGMIWVFQIPLAYILSNHTSLDVNGVRWAMVISTGVAAIATFAYFLRGKWKVKSI